MSKDAIWQAFAETGDPLYYMLYKATQDEPYRRSAPQNDPGDTPPERGLMRYICSTRFRRLSCAK